MPSFISFRNTRAVVKFIYDSVSRNSSRVSVKKPAKAGIFKKVVGHPDIFGPPGDCLNCNGTGCQFC